MKVQDLVQNEIIPVIGSNSYNRFVGSLISSLFPN